MGNTTSTHISLKEFKNQVFSQTVFFVAKYANHNVAFKSEAECTGDFLPALPGTAPGGEFEAILNYYGQDYHRDQLIEDYVNNHIINSQENLTRFHKILMAKLSQDSEQSLEEHGDENIDLESVATNVEKVCRAYQAEGGEEGPAAAESKEVVVVDEPLPTPGEKVLTERPEGVITPQELLAASTEPNNLVPAAPETAERPYINITPKVVVVEEKEKDSAEVVAAETSGSPNPSPAKATITYDIGPLGDVMPIMGGAMTGMPVDIQSVGTHRTNRTQQTHRTSTTNRTAHTTRTVATSKTTATGITKGTTFSCKPSSEVSPVVTTNSAVKDANNMPVVPIITKEERPDECLLSTKW